MAETEPLASGVRAERPGRPGRVPVAGSARNARAVREGLLALLPDPLPYPSDLPVTARRAEIGAALSAHQVVVVAGATGSGKSTQIPKICLEAGRGRAGMIGHTQPRRIAARSIAERVAEELGSSLGGVVGYKVRFTDRVRPGTALKLMTDGILLAELRSDPSLSAYDTLIIDEAHERSLNIDFVLGYLRRLLPSRPDLKVLVTSATIDTGRFASHFDGAPVVEVSGRTYPVEVRYRPMTVGLASLDDEADDAGTAPPAPPAPPGGAAASDAAPYPARSFAAGAPKRGYRGKAARSTRPSGATAEEDEVMDEVQAICEAVAELCQEGPGDILVFLAGEREIRDTAEALAKAGTRGAEVVPLYGRLSSAEQHRVFEPHSGRRVVLATNVAETSLTVPGVRYVVDPGTARISRYSRRTKVQRLPIEPISRASADQRAGRCGRTGPGICVRLYSEDDLAGRRPFTEPEVLRTNLASVVLQMAAIGLGPVEDFPFVDPPDRRSIKDGVVLLEELGALVRDGDAGHSITRAGRDLAQLPLDPRLGRMVLEAGRFGCVDEVLVIAAGLSVQDPRERPADAREAASALHHRFDDGSSDFVTVLNLWDYVQERLAELSSGQFRRLCRREMISHQRVREWQDVHAQLTEVARQVGIGGSSLGRPVDEGSRSQLHQALLAGLVTQVGLREGDRSDFAAPRNARFSLWPGSVLSGKAARWVMVAEMVETSRLWGRVAAPVRPQWVERAAAHLLKWSYSEPAWDAARAEAFVQARAALLGLPVVAGRRTELSRLDLGEARELFIRHALVDGDWDGAPEVVHENLRTVREARAALARARRHDLMAGDEALVDFYAARLGNDVTSARSFTSWWRRQRPQDRSSLVVSAPELGGAVAGISVQDFPDAWSSPARPGDRPVALHYNWDPGDDADGVVVEVPLARFDSLAGAGLDWQVPGLRAELVQALLRSLPKEARRQLVPIAERAEEFVAKTVPGTEPLVHALSGFVNELGGVAVRPGDFDWSKVPGHLRPTICVTGENGELLARGKDIAAVAGALRPRLRAELQRAAVSAPWGPPGRRMLTWEIGELPETFEPEWLGYRLVGFPALADEGGSVSVRVFTGSSTAKLSMAAGTRRLVLLGIPGRHQLADRLERALGNQAKLALAYLGSLGPRTPGSPGGGLGYLSARDLAGDVIAAALDGVIAASGGPARDAGAFGALVAAGRRDLDGSARKVMADAAALISKAHLVARRAQELYETALEGSPLWRCLEDVFCELGEIVGPRFVSRAGTARLADLDRYLSALQRRLDKLPADALRDLALAERARAALRGVEEAAAQARKEGRGAGTVTSIEELRWTVQELRVSFFAQALGTRGPVSEQRVARAAAELLRAQPTSSQPAANR